MKKYFMSVSSHRSLVKWSLWEIDMLAVVSPFLVGKTQKIKKNLFLVFFFIKHFLRSFVAVILEFYVFSLFYKFTFVYKGVVYVSLFHTHLSINFQICQSAIATWWISKCGIYVIKCSIIIFLLSSRDLLLCLLMKSYSSWLNW